MCAACYLLQVLQGDWLFSMLPSQSRVWICLWLKTLFSEVWCRIGVTIGLQLGVRLGRRDGGVKFIQVTLETVIFYLELKFANSAL